MSRKQQNYRNNGFRKLLTIMHALVGSMYNSVFNRNQRNIGRAGGHLDTHYQSGGGSGSHMQPMEPKKAAIRKKKHRKQTEKSQRINRKRQAGICSYK